jgi:hypothetical protein
MDDKGRSLMRGVVGRAIAFPPAWSDDSYLDLLNQIQEAEF